MSEQTNQYNHNVRVKSTLKHSTTSLVFRTRALRLLFSDVLVSTLFERHVVSQRVSERRLLLSAGQTVLLAVQIPTHHHAKLTLTHKQHTNLELFRKCLLHAVSLHSHLHHYTTLKNDFGSK